MKGEKWIPEGFAVVGTKTWLCCQAAIRELVILAVNNAFYIDICTRYSFIITGFDYCISTLPST